MSTQNPLLDYQFNTIQSPTDVRDRLASSLLPAAEAEYVAKAKEYWVIPKDKIKVLDQGASSMCTGFTAVQPIKHFNFVETGKLEDFSPAFTYADRDPADYQGEGDHLRNTLKQIRKNGVSYLKDFDFIGTYPESVLRYNNLSVAVKDRARSFKIKSYYYINMFANQQEALKVLDKYGVMLPAAIPLYQSFTKAYSNGGIVPIPNAETEKFYGGHAIAIVGYKFINNKLHYIIVNSWGTEHGDGGFYYIPCDYPWYEGWLSFDYKKLTIELSMDAKDPNNQKGICFVNGKPVIIDAKAFIKDNRTMVPARAISELVGMEVFWDAKSKTVRITEYLSSIYLTIGDKQIMNADTLQVTEMDVAPVIVNNRTYVPLRFVTEMLGLIVKWDATTRLITITNY